MTSTVDGAPAGAGTVIEVALVTLKLPAPVAPNFTEVTPVKLVPVIVTDVPPVVGPEAGLTDGDGGRGDVGVEIGARRGARSPRGGDGHVHGAGGAGRRGGGDRGCGVDRETVAATVPKFTAVAPVKLEPVMVTDVPPAVGPDVGLTAVIVGVVEALALETRSATAAARRSPSEPCFAVGWTAAEVLVS